MLAGKFNWLWIAEYPEYLLKNIFLWVPNVYIPIVMGTRDKNNIKIRRYTFRFIIRQQFLQRIDKFVPGSPDNIILKAEFFFETPQNIQTQFLTIIIC